MPGRPRHPAVRASSGGNLRNGRSLLCLSQAVSEASIPPFNKTGNTWGSKPDQTPPVHPANADTCGVTLEAAATGRSDSWQLCVSLAWVLSLTDRAGAPGLCFHPVWG